MCCLIIYYTLFCAGIKVKKSENYICFFREFKLFDIMIKNNLNYGGNIWKPLYMV